VSTNSISAPSILLPWVYDDGGRSAAGFKGTAGDCVTRALAIATGTPYREMYDRLARSMKSQGFARSARNGVEPKVYKPLLSLWGFVWTPTMFPGQGTRIHLAQGEVPQEGIYILRLSRHLCTVVDGTIHDTYDPGRNATRCVYGWWQRATDGRGRAINVADQKVLCDQPGCDRPATTISYGEGKNTGTKTWYACDEHKAVQP